MLLETLLRTLLARTIMMMMIIQNSGTKVGRFCKGYITDTLKIALI